MPPARIALWVSSLGGFALAARSVFIGPVPVWVVLLAATAYIGLVVTGVLVPRLEMFGDVLWHGDEETRLVALTFDDGPNPETTPKVLEMLAAAQVRATFFVVGEKAALHPEVVRDIARAGHELGVHGFTHDRLYAFLPPDAVREDLTRALDAVESAAGVRPKWFRPPVGQVSPRTAAGAKLAGVEIVGWSVRGFDGLRGADPADVRRRLERGLEPGAIMLMHDAAERDDFVPAALAALPGLLEEAKRRGLGFGTVSEVLASEA